MRSDVRSGNPDAHALVADDAEIDLAGIGRALWRQKWWTIGPTLTVAMFAFGLVNLLPPRFQSEARVLISGHENVFLRPEVEKVDHAPEIIDQEAVTSQIQLALSRDLARQVAAKLSLGARSEFDPVLRRDPWMVSALRLAGIGKDALRMTPEERVLETYYDRLTVYQVDKSRVIAVAFQSHDPDLAARVANAVADAYVLLLRATTQEQTRAAGQWLAGEIEDLRRKVANAEGKVEAFRAKSKLFNGLNNTPLSNQQLADLNGQLAVARSRKADAEAKALLVRDAVRAGTPLDFPDFLNSELIRRLSEQRAMLRSQLAEQSSMLLDAHPRIKELRAQIADLEREMHLEAERVARAVENDARIASTRVNTLSDNIEQLERQAASAGEQEVELRALEREARAERDLLESYLAKYRETTARTNLSVAPAEARVISRATVSNIPYFPRRLPIVLIPALATLVVVAGMVTTRELMIGSRDRSIAAPAASEPRQTALPKLDGPREPPVPGQEPGARADGAPAGELPEPARSLADIVDALGGTGRRGCRVIVVGAARRVGTTRCAVELARLLVANGRVVLIDLALGAPSLAAWAVDPGAPGITELVSGEASIGRAITRDRGSNVHIVPAGRIDVDASEAMLRSDRLRMALDALAYAYDYLVMDVGDADEIILRRVINRASIGVLVTTPESKSAAGAARQRLMSAGLADVMIVQAKDLLFDAAQSAAKVAAA
jgi:polysaccharide biosynthesis transport protein